MAARRPGGGSCSGGLLAGRERTLVPRALLYVMAPLRVCQCGRLLPDVQVLGCACDRARRPF